MTESPESRCPKPTSRAWWTKKSQSQVIARMKEAGFTYVTIDLEGFRSGSMNEVLKSERKPDLLILS